MFLTEKELRETFWNSYNRSKRAKRWQFECPIRDGNADLITIESFQNNWRSMPSNLNYRMLKKFYFRLKGIFHIATRVGSLFQWKKPKIF